MYDTYAPRPIHSDGDAFTDLVRQLDRAEPRRAGAAGARELAFDEELRFDERRGTRKRVGASRARPPSPRMQDVPAAFAKRDSVSRLGPAKGTEEDIAVDDAQMQARKKSVSWKEYVENLDRLLDRRLERSREADAA